MVQVNWWNFIHDDLGLIFNNKVLALSDNPENNLQVPRFLQLFKPINVVGVDKERLKYIVRHLHIIPN